MRKTPYSPQIKGKAKPKRVSKLPPGRWMLISEAAKIKGYSPMTIRTRFLLGKIDAIIMDNRERPLLVNLDQIK